MKNKVNNKCHWCHSNRPSKAKGEIKYYIIADDMENPSPYHETCIKYFNKFVFFRIFNVFSNASDDYIKKRAEEVVRFEAKHDKLNARKSGVSVH